MRILETNIHLALKAGLFVCEKNTLNCSGTKFGIITGKRSKDENRRETCAKTFEGVKSLLGGALQAFGRIALQNFLVPVPRTTVTLRILAFTAKLELHPAHDFAIDRILFKQGLELFGVQERSGQRLDNDILRAGPCRRIRRIRKHAEHGFDTIEHGTSFNIDNGTGKFHSFTVGGFHVVFQEARCHIVSLVTLMATEIAFRKHDRSLFTFRLAKGRAVNLVQRANRIRTATILDHRLNALDITLRKNRRR